MVETKDFPESRMKVEDLLTSLCWIAYSPTHFDPTASPIQWPGEADVREDLRVLRSVGFNGLVTYGSNYMNGGMPNTPLDIAALAQEAGFEGMIVGVWDPAHEQELQIAEQAGFHPIVVGYSVGNEGLDIRYDLDTLVFAMERLRSATGKPVSTTEEVHDYYENSPLWAISAWTGRVFKSLNSVSDKLIIFKEVGLPSDGDVGLSEANQAQYYQLLRETHVIYVVFEAFDAPWKHLSHPEPGETDPWPDPEPHWGIFTSDRSPKEVAAGICSIRAGLKPENWVVSARRRNALTTQFSVFFPL
jgi:exo-beta-1,3-glucanase (GH17 family)